MKQVLIMALIALFALSGCVLVPPGHDPNGPGNSANAPGHNKQCGHGPGKSSSAAGQQKKHCS